ncbi:MAG: DUF4159 domain-containing protein [Tepidisphaeraceae bacterium]
MLNRWTARLVVMLLISAAPPPTRADEFVNPKANIPPKASPQRRGGGEGLPPMPIPLSSPLRRTEKQRQPAPPGLVGCITFSPASLQGSGVDWQTTTIDIERWVDFTNDQLRQHYRFVETDFSKFSYDPAELPILYFTGWKALPPFDEATISKLRQYLIDGGTWVVHSNCGRPEFNASFRREIRRIFPDRELAPIPADHPLFGAFYPITSMRLRNGSQPWKQVPPYLETVNIGTRAAVIFSPVDLSCGWDAGAHPIEGGILYDQNDALKLASNIVTYCLAEYQYARFFSHQKIYHEASEKTRDQLVLGQIVHGGDWDPTPQGLPNLLKMIDQNTTMHVQFKRVPVEAQKDDLLQFPVLYMVGQRDFQFSNAARQRLRQYCDHGGTIIVDCAVGSSEFDAAFRREMALIYPDRQLKPLPPNHPIYGFVYDVRRVELAPLARQLLPEVQAPRLEAIDVDGTLPVIYSPLSMSAGWEQLPRAYNKGYANDDALKLGVNVLMYVVSH